jgi:hypothetical protein
MLFPNLLVLYYTNGNSSKVNTREALLESKCENCSVLSSGYSAREDRRNGI